MLFVFQNDENTLKVLRNPFGQTDTAIPHIWVDAGWGQGAVLHQPAVIRKRAAWHSLSFPRHTGKQLLRGRGGDSRAKSRKSRILQTGD